MQTSITSRYRQADVSTGSQVSPERQWQKELAAAVISVDDLLLRLGLSRKDFSDHLPEIRSFPLFVPENYVDRMISGEPEDPLLRQVLPISLELERTGTSFADPVGDLDARLVPGMLQKYHGRALMVIASQCAVHCRYCFRREYDYESEPKSFEKWGPAFEQLAADDSIEEVILSGGDPLMISDRRFGEFVSRIEKIEHIQRLRIHSRMPIVLPSRVTASLVQTLQDTRLSPIVVVHANHPNEIIGDCSAALRRFVQSGIPVLNQSVLLNGINDNVEALVELSRRLINLGVMPYYLHQLDRVHGGVHFEVEIEIGRQLIAEMQKQLPGYAVPKFVQEIAGEASKTLL